MSIVDQNGILAGAQAPYQINKNGPAGTVGRLMSLFYSAGMPGATMTSGAFCLVAYRVLAMLPMPLAGVGASINALQMGFTKQANNTVPFLLWLPGSTTAPTIFVQSAVSQG